MARSLWGKIADIASRLRLIQVNTSCRLLIRTPTAYLGRLYALKAPSNFIHHLPEPTIPAHLSVRVMPPIQAPEHIGKLPPQAIMETAVGPVHLAGPQVYT